MHGIALGRSQPPVNLQAWYTNAMMGAHQEAMTIAVGGIVPDSTLCGSNFSHHRILLRTDERQGLYCRRGSHWLPELPSLCSQRACGLLPTGRRSSPFAFFWIQSLGLPEPRASRRAAVSVPRARRRRGKRVELCRRGIRPQAQINREIFSRNREFLARTGNFTHENRRMRFSVHTGMEKQDRPKPTSPRCSKCGRRYEHA
jgi:hypothetical protein